MSTRRAIQLFSSALVLTRSPAWPLPCQSIFSRAVSTRTVLTRRKSPAFRVFAPKPRVSPMLLDFRAVVAAGDVSAAMAQYPLLVQDSALGRNDTLELARLLHNRYRRLKSVGNTQTAAKDELLGYVKRLIADLTQRKLQPHPLASLHILSYCKDSEEFDVGLEFWEWILSREGGFLDSRTYGAGIELLAYYGKPLHHLESLYKQALKRYPGAFSEYHLSPHAAVQDPSRPSNAPGSSLLLLQGILTARLVNGDWRNAYLALDTALRLYPDQVPLRFFELFIYGRPLNEAYHVFHVACRSGTPSTERTFTTLLARLAIYQGSRQSILERIDVLESMLTSLKAYHGAGRGVGVWHLNKIIQGILQILPAASLPQAAEEYEPLHKMMDSTTELLMDIFSELGVSADTATFNVFISEGGKLKRPDMVAGAIQRLHDAGLKPNRFTRRCLLLAAGRFGDAARVEDTWRSIIEPVAESDVKVVGYHEWAALVKAGIWAGNVAFVKEQFGTYKSSLPEHIAALEGDLELPARAGGDLVKMENIQSEETEGASSDAQAPPMDPLPEILKKLSDIPDQLNTFRSSARSPQSYDFCASPLTINPPNKTQKIEEFPDGSYRDFYSKLSTGSGSGIAAAKGEEGGSTIRTMTGFTYAELRYQNWKSINELLLMASDYEAVEARRVKQALEAGKPIPRSRWRIGNNDGDNHRPARPPKETGVDAPAAASEPLHDDDGNQLGSSPPTTQEAGPSATQSATGETSGDDDGNSQIPAWMVRILRLRGLDVNGYPEDNK